MKFQNYRKIDKCALPLLILLLVCSTFAQTSKDTQPSTIIYKGLAEKEMGVVAGANLYCAGYLQTSPVDTSIEVVGAESEKDQNFYSQGDFLYISAGSGSGVKVGDVFSVFRPRGSFKSKFSKKKLGIYIEEVGGVEIMRVRNDVAVGVVKTSCSVILLGDLLKKMPKRVSPKFKARPATDRFATSSGNVSGRIVLAKDGRELIGREQIVYVDLGREDSVKAGDYLTVFRPLGSGNTFRSTLSDRMDNREGGFESDRYRGGRYSNQASRKAGTNADGRIVSSENAKSRRPKGLRRVVGELVVLKVSERTATAVVVRTSSEIHTGDHVEVQ